MLPDTPPNNGLPNTLGSNYGAPDRNQTEIPITPPQKTSPTLYNSEQEVCGTKNYDIEVKTPVSYRRIGWRDAIVARGRQRSAW